MRKIPIRNKHKIIIAYTLIDDEDFEQVGFLRWHLDKGYAKRNIMINGVRKHISLHRTLLNPPEHLEVDHINQNKLDNRRKNLRLCTRSENASNVFRKNKSSKYIGVSYYKRNGTWIVFSSRLKGKRRYLGNFKSEKIARKAYLDSLN